MAASRGLYFSIRMSHKPMISIRPITSLTQKIQKRNLTFDVQSNQEFNDKVMASTTPTIVDFHASWCRPCKVFTPILTSVIDSFDGKVDLAKVDVDELEDIAMEYSVRSIPTVLAMKDGKVVSSFVGAQDKEVITKFVSDLIDT